MLNLSIIIPVRDEENNINELSDRIKNTMKMLNVSFEVIFITDINKDNTFDVLQELNKNDQRFKTLKLSNAYGQHIAILAGLNFCKGEAVVIMDGDLQDYPEDISKLYSKLKEGFDIVYAIKDNKNNTAIQNAFSKIFMFILNKISEKKIKNDINMCMFRIISRRTVEAIMEFKEAEPVISFLMDVIGFPTASVKVSSGERKLGKTKYSFLRRINLAINSLISFSTKPLRIISIIGLSISGLSLIYLCVILIQSLFIKMGVLGWPTLVALITFIGGVQLFSLGIIGEYIGRIFIETKRRPLYIIDNKIGFFE